MQERPDPPRRRRIRPELLLLLASIVVSVLLAEGVLRIYYVVTYSGTLEDLRSDVPPPGTEVDLGDMLMVSAYPRLIYQLKPRMAGVRWKGVSIDTNSRGFREATEPAPRDERTIRIVGLGDSVMFGLGVEENERYMDVLEQRLNQGFPSARWETITLAAPGYNLVTEVEALERYGLEYEPDLLIYGFVFNDYCLPNFVNPRRSIWSFDSFIKYYVVDSGSEVPLLGRQFIARENRGVDPADLKKQGLDVFEQSYCSAENFAPGYRHLVGEESFHRALDELAEVGRERGIATIFLSYGGSGRAGEVPLPEGMIFIDFFRLYRKHLRDHGYASLKDSDLVLSETDTHPSVKAHRLIGTALAERLAELGLVEDILARRVPGD